MRHARADYDERIQDVGLHDAALVPEGSTPIAEDEPVFLLRAKDALAPGIVRTWASRLQRETRYDRTPEQEAAIDAAMRQAARMEEWQRQHGSKMPDAPVAEVVR